MRRPCYWLTGLTVLLCSLLPWLVHGQPLQQNNFHHLGTREGLLSDDVNACVQDKTGYVWIAGKEGLQRYDGYRFLDFKHAEGNKESLPDNNILSLCVDGSNRLWLLAANHTAGYFDTRRFVFHPVAVQLGGRVLDRVEGTLQADAQQNILLLIKSTENRVNGVVHYDSARHLLVDDDKRFERPEGWQLLSFSFDSTTMHNLWMCTDQGLIKYDVRSGSSAYRGHNLQAEPIITALQEHRLVQNPLLDREGNFWMTASDKEGKNTHLLEYQAASQKVIDYYAAIDSALQHGFYKITSIVAPDSGSVWITGRSIFMKAGAGIEIIPSNLPGAFSIHYDDIKGVVTDREQNAWIPTNRGLYYINAKPSPFRYTNIGTDVTDFIQLPGRQVIVASWGRGLFAYDSALGPTRSDITAQSRAQQEKLVWAMHRLPNGDIWRTQQDGWLYIYHAATHTTEKIHDPVFDNKTIRQMAEDRLGNLWFSTQGNVLIRWSARDKQFRVMHSTQKPVFRLYADHQGDIWAIAESAFKINIADGSVLAQYETGPPDGRHLLRGDLTDILQYSDSVFIVSGTGLSIINTRSQHISYFTSDNGLPSAYVSNIITDKRGELWIATEKGLCNLSFKKSELHIYNFEDGIYNSAFTPVSSALLGDGRIALGTNQEWVIFDPSQVKAGGRFPAAPIEITGISVMNKPLTVDSLLSLHAVQLDYTSNAIAIYFSALIYSSRYSVAYQLEGLDKTPVPAGAAGEAIYSYLPPGNYRFKVGVLDEQGKLSQYSAFAIRVQAPFWKDWPFYVLLLLVIGFVLWWVDRQRLQRAQQLLQVRNAIGRDLHAEVSTALDKISILSELADIKAATDTERSKDYIRDIRLKSRSTQLAMEDVMWSIEPANDAMTSILERMQETADALQHEYSAQIGLRVGKGVDNYQLSMKERLAFLLIYKKSLQFFVEAMQATVVDVSLERVQQDLMMNIAAATGSNNINDPLYANALADIEQRAATIHCLLDISQRGGSTAITAVIKK